MRKLYILPAIALLAAMGFLTYTNFIASEPQPDQTSQQATQTADPDAKADADTEPKTFIRIAAMGDMLPHDTVNLRAKTDEGYDYLQFFDKITSRLDGADIIFCNQESPSAGAEYGITGFPSFNAPTEFSRDLAKLGCNVINLANNHVADKGQQAINATLDTWDNLDTLAVSGANRTQAEQNSVSYFEVAGKKFAFIAFTDLSNNRSIEAHSINMFSQSLVTSLASEAAANADYVIASAHWGIEDSSTVSSAQRGWAELLASNGVDLIIGTGPHVLQPVETIGKTTVFYSIGNFLSTQLTIDQLIGGIAYIDIPLGEGEPELSFVPTYMSYTWNAADANAENLLARDNLDLYPLSEASLLIEQSLFDTSAQTQTTRVRDLLNQKTSVEILP